MIYKIMDVVTGETVVTLDSKAEVQNWFSCHARLNDLNVTGKDIKTPYTGLPYTPLFLCGYNNDTIRLRIRLRKYQVLDEEGRSVDPRLWSPAPPAPTPKNPSYTPIIWHKRVRCGCRKAPALIQQMKRESCKKLELDIRPVRDNTKLRVSKYKTEKYEKGPDEKSWKNKKTTRQWGRHKKGFIKADRLEDSFIPVEEEYDILQDVDFSDDELAYL